MQMIYLTRRTSWLGLPPAAVTAIMLLHFSNGCGNFVDHKVPSTSPRGTADLRNQIATETEAAIAVSVVSHFAQTFSVTSVWLAKDAWPISEELADVEIPERVERQKCRTLNAVDADLLRRIAWDDLPTLLSCNVTIVDNDQLMNERDGRLSPKAVAALREGLIISLSAPRLSPTLDEAVITALLRTKNSVCYFKVLLRSDASRNWIVVKTAMVGFE